MGAEVPVSSAGLVTPSSARQPVQSSGQLTSVPVDSIFVTSGLTAEQYEAIFLLSREVQTLCRKLARDFIELSNQEARFRMGAQAMSHEKNIQERPDRSTGKRDEATKHSGEVTWLQTNSLLLCHTIEYQNNMIQLVTRSQEAIQALHERIWKVVRRVMESAGKSVADGLEIALHLVNMLPSIPPQLTFNTVTAELPGFTPEALSYASPLSINQGTMTVLGEEILKGAHDAEEKVMPATWHVTAMDAGLVKVTMIENKGGNGPNRPGTSLSLAVHASTFSDWRTTGYRTARSPSHSPSHSPSQSRHSPGSKPRPHTSDSSVSSFGSLSPTESESDTESSWGNSDGPEWQHSSSPDIIFIGKTGDDNSSDEEETLSPLDISNSDTEEIQMAAARRKACQNDALFAAWQDLQICQGTYEIGQHDQRVCDHPLAGKCCEAPDQVGPPISYMEELGVFKPAESINNPMGFCQFYWISPEKSNVLTGPRSAECARRIYGLVEVAKRVGQQLTVIVFDGESVSPICLLGELHFRLALLRITIHTPGEANVGVQNCVYCCPMCTYVIKNNITLLNHIIVGHYWGSFSCRKCLAFAAATAEWMRRHIAGCGQSQVVRGKAHSARHKAHWGYRSGRKSRKGKKRTKEGVSAAARKKLHCSPTRSNPTVTSQEQAKKH